MGSEKEYHPALSSLSWLFGVWESVEAEVFYPTISTTKYTEIVEFHPLLLQPVIEYKSETWHAVKKTKLHCETGYFRIDPESQKIALLVAHIFGLTEVSEGSVDKEELCLESQSLSRESFATVTPTVKIVRKLALKGEELHSNLLLQTDTQPLQDHQHSRYKKKSN